MQLEQKILELIDAPNICVLGTTGPGVWPHAMPMWYLFEDGEFIFTCKEKAQKRKNVERHGKATVVIDQRDPPYYAAALRGEARVGPPLTTDQWLRLAMRYLDEETARTYASRKNWESITIRVRPTKLIEFNGIDIA
jgi:PPOX class probable F420-dependent enzyme